MSTALLRAEGVAKHYPLKAAGFSTRKGLVLAVQDVSLSVAAGEVFGLVGESGCGKSTLGRVLLRLEEPTAGRVAFDGADVSSFDRARLKQFRREAPDRLPGPLRGARTRAAASGSSWPKPLDIHRWATPAERRERTAWLLQVVGLLPEHARRYPHEFSGGQRQRIVHRPGAGAEPAAAVGRRAGLGAGRVHPGAGDQPAQGAAGRASS